MDRLPARGATAIGRRPRPPLQPGRRVRAGWTNWAARSRGREGPGRGRRAASRRVQPRHGPAVRSGVRAQHRAGRRRGRWRAAARTSARTTREPELRADSTGLTGAAKMRSSLLIASLLSLPLVASACKDEAPVRTGPEPMRAPPSGVPTPTPAGPPATRESAEPGDTPEPDARPLVVLPERPRADPDIDRALDLIGGSGRRFIDPPEDPDARPTEYTAEQFAAMLRTKWDWLGYDLTELEPWLDEIA